jgi:hypothetical protein
MQEVLIVMGTCLQKRYRSSIKPALSGLGKGIRPGHKAQKYIAKAKQQRTGCSDIGNIQRCGTAVCCGTGIGKR